MDSTIPIQQIDLGLFRKLLDQLDASIKTRDYHRIDRDATAAIDQLHESQLLVLTDIRAHARAMQGHFDGALEDANDMTSYAPERGAGYARLGEVLCMSGRQAEAIAVYDDGLNVKGLDQNLIERLQAGKTAAATKNKARIDYLAELPLELANNIIQRLPEGEKSICLSVSNAWRKRILDCSYAWTHLTVTGDQKGLQLTSVIPVIGRYVEDLNINTDNSYLHSRCLEYMIDKQFDKIQTLKMQGKCVFYSTVYDSLVHESIPLATNEWIRYTGRISIAFWQMRETLTSLSVNLGDNHHALTIADILLPCCNLSDLSYTTFPMPLPGDFSTMKNHTALVNLELKASTISGDNIREVLQRCPRLRRLVMTGCTHSVIDPITKHGSSLEILGCNSARPIPSLGHMATDGSSGLRKIFIDSTSRSYGRSRMQIDSAFSLVHKNMATLDTVILNTSSDLGLQGFQQIDAVYPDFKLENVSTLMARLYPRTQPLILQSIRDTTTLTQLDALNVHDMQGLVDALMEIHPIIRLQISQVETTAASASLIQLFEKYAALSKATKTPTLQSAIFRECAEITDPVLTSLAAIQSLHRIIFRGLNNVTAGGIGEFLDSISHSIRNVELNSMACITDSHIFALHKCPLLVTVVLQGLRNVSEEGVRKMVVCKKRFISGKRFYTLLQLTVKQCPRITELSVCRFKTNIVKDVVYEK